MFRLDDFYKKYKTWIILGGIGTVLYFFFFGKFFHDKTDSLYEVIMMQFRERSNSNTIE